MSEENQNEKRSLKVTDLRDVLSLVKDKLQRDVESACGLFFSDEGGGGGPVTSLYAIGEED